MLASVAADGQSVSEGLAYAAGAKNAAKAGCLRAETGMAAYCCAHAWLASQLHLFLSAMQKVLHWTTWDHNLNDASAADRHHICLDQTSNNNEPAQGLSTLPTTWMGTSLKDQATKGTAPALLNPLWHGVRTARIGLQCCSAINFRFPVSRGVLRAHRN